MVAKRRRPKASSKTAGPRGPRGKTGRTGATGPAGAPANGALERLTAQVAEIVKELQTQLMRIAQIQLQLDRLATGQFPESTERRRIPRTEN